MKRFFTSWWTISIGTTVLLILLFAVGLPLFITALKPLWVRLTIVTIFIALWALIFYLRRRKAKRAEAALAAELAGGDRAGEEAGAVESRMREAIEKLRSASGKKRNYLYSRPWYVIIGPPGAGKTTALINSGLRFPFSDQTLGGSGGTRNLDFLFADEAVLVDTAGRYTTQDSDSEVDRSGWTSLLRLLRRHRPFEPINGVFVAMPIDELQKGDVRAIDRHAAIVRHRLHEIRQELQTELPVYLVLTKSDLLAGFTDYFGDLDVDGRRAVFGHTFDWKAERLSSTDVTSAFDHMVNDVQSRHPKRLHEEQDIRRRGLILGFPSQLHAVRAPLHRFIEGAFLNEDRPSGRLRGFYLTSGMQDGGAIDRILEGVSQSFGGQAGPANSQEGRAFFLNRLLQDVAFAEAGLPVADAAAVRKRKSQMTMALAGIAGVATLLLLAWVVSFISNRGFQAETNVAAREVAEEMDATQVDLVRVSESDIPLDQLVPLLNQLRNLPEGYAAGLAGGPSLTRRFGLFQSGLSRQNEEAYRIALRRILLPRIVLRLEQQMQSRMADPVALYEPLKVYLMLGGAAPQGRIDGKIVRNYVQRDWANEQFAGGELAPIRKDLALHLKALTEDENISAAWPGRRAPLDANLVSAARASIGQMSLAQRAYAIMLQKAANPAGDWQMSAVLREADARAFANPDVVMNQSVPYFFTKAGFTKSYAMRLATVERDLKGELWVLGEDAAKDSLRQEMSGLKSGVSAAYAADYIAQWERVVASLKPANFFSDQQAYSAFAKTPSPLKTVLSAVRANTTFGGGASGKAGQLARQRLEQNRYIRTAGQIAGASGAGGGGASADAQIAAHFADLNAWVGDGKAAGPIDQFIDQVRESFKQVLVAQSAGAGGDSGAALAQAMAPLQQSALQVPDMVQSFAQDVAKGGSAAQVGALQGETAVAWQDTVLPACQQAIDGKYPFDNASLEDAGLAQVRETLGPGGMLMTFVNQRLGQYLDRGDEYWRWRDDDPIASGFSPVSPANFQKAAVLQEAFSEGLPLEFELVSIGSKVSRVELSTGGVTLRFGANDDEPKQIAWQLGGGLVRSSEMKIYSAAEGNGEEVIWRHSKEGPWSLFRVLDRADKRNKGEGQIEATFNPGAAKAVFRISFPPSQNPFSGGGLWSMKCPQTL
ncbi:Intracellular multiplication and human macrophage-killing [Tsuneonella dongtanensis]|uniref:Intracellular multiplication and human macrophage-killing n=1 Tax=Tsuneonella dongtanensis TaxID=692370 RepID=A0A1B2ABD6_9SPHN|nr:type VI secretion system membrane subunit TssM [Tsuneonella dongtanensis]ANY19388.1 Intracellular multiplication and human macrophage-killing [Tsuneonella dongtanensis]